MFQRNIGSTERVIRIVAGLGITALAFVGPQTPWALLGLVPLATGLMGWCPPYAIFGINTCKVQTEARIRKPPGSNEKREADASRFCLWPACSFSG